MKNILTTFFLTLVVFVPITRAQEAPPPAPPHFYDIVFGTVQYKITGEVEGTETLYFDQAGMRQSRYRIFTTQQFGTNINIILNIGEEIMLIDPNKKLGRKSIDLDVKQALANHKPEDTQLISIAALILSGAEQVKTENVLDRPCDVWENKKTKAKMWLWKGIPLKIETHPPQGKVTQVATQIDESTAIDEKVFTVLEGVHFIDQDLNQILLSMRSSK
jgi:hypothetical protein